MLIGAHARSEGLTVVTNDLREFKRMPSVQVEVVKLGNSRLISPVGHRWDDLFATGPRASPDFMLTREQPLEEECEPL